MEIKKQLRNFIIENFNISDKRLDNDTSLIQSGIVDSVSFLEILIFIEKTFAVNIDISSLQDEFNDSIDGLSGYIAANLAKK